jgi:23S rRNA (adenine-N6)-dimethyltransferase
MRPVTSSRKSTPGTNANIPLRYSQNYLHSSALIRRLLRLANLTGDDTVVEIGPGKGSITRQLAGICRRVIAIEYDAVLYRKLCHDFAGMPQVEIRHADFLNYRLPVGSYKIFANIPFTITSAIVEHIMAGPNMPDDAYLVMQQEAARRFAGIPYAKESLKSLLIKPDFTSAIRYAFAHTDFTPMPSVECVLLHLRRRRQPLLNRSAFAHYHAFLAYVFSQSGNVAARMKSIFTRAQLKRLCRTWNFPLTANPADLSFDQWFGVFSYYQTGVPAIKRSLVERAGGR